MADQKPSPVVGILMGSQSDWGVMREAAEILADLGIPFEAKIVSAHRTPMRVARYAMEAWERGIRVIIAGAGGAAHLPGMLAAHTVLPIIGVPVQSKALNGMDSLLSIVQMPPGVPVMTMAINGAKNAGLSAASILALSDSGLCRRLASWREALTRSIPDEPKDEPRIFQ